MMNPLDSIWGTIISGFVLAIVLALIFKTPMWGRLGGSRVPPERPIVLSRPVVELSIGG